MISEQYFHLFFISSGFILQKIEQNVYQFKMFVIQRLYLISFATTSTRNYCVKTLVKLPICVSGYIHLWYHIYLFFRSNSIHYLIWYILDTTIKKMANYVINIYFIFLFYLFVCFFWFFFGIIELFTFDRLVNGIIRSMLHRLYVEHHFWRLHR